MQGCLLGAPMEGVAGLEALWKLERRKARRAHDCSHSGYITDGLPEIFA